jgi:repressor of nif and glnA expression
MKNGYSRGVEVYVLLIIGADPNRKWINEEKEQHYQIIKEKAEAATTEEIKYNLDKFGIKWSDTSLQRKLHSLREKGLIRYGTQHGIHVITQKGLKDLELKDLELLGKGRLNTGSGVFSSIYWVHVKEGKVANIDMYTRFKDQKFIQEFIENAAKRIKTVNVNKYIESNQSFVFSDPAEYEHQQMMQFFLRMLYSDTAYKIRFLQSLGVSDNLLKEVFDGIG